MKFKIISFDMFQTLVDVNARKQDVWSGILGKDYSEDRAEMFWNDTLRRLSDYTRDIRCGVKSFEPMKRTFSACYERMFEEHGIDMEVNKAIEILFREHRRAQVYRDALDFFKEMDDQLRVWISSDTDMDMISTLLGMFKHEYAFISEEIGAYKQDEQGRFFKHVLKVTGASPEDILHVGDGIADIVGAEREGISTCWINRTGKEWDHEVRPDYTVTSLAELNKILDLK